MTQRIRGITDEEATGPAKELLEATNKMLGRTANLMRILAHSPYLPPRAGLFFAKQKAPGLVRAWAPLFDQCSPTLALVY